MLVPPESKKLTFWEMILAGVLWIPFFYGLQTFRRLLSVADAVGENERRILGSEVFWQVQRMVVLPRCQVHV